jgi:hypothetical protein
LTNHGGLLQFTYSPFPTQPAKRVKLNDREKQDDVGCYRDRPVARATQWTGNQ